MFKNVWNGSAGLLYFPPDSSPGEQMKYLFAILLAGLLLLGCTAPPAGQPSAPQQPAAPGAPSGETPPAEQPPAETPPAEQPPAEQPPAEGGLDLDTWSMAALTAFGAPVHCTVTYGGDMPGSYEMYIWGEKMRVEGTYEGAEGAEAFVTISKDDRTYMPASMMGEMPGAESCDWFYFEASEPEPGEPAEPGTYETMGMEDFEAPPFEFHCEPAVFGDEKFATPGQLCDFMEVMRTSMCEGLTGDAYTQCLAAFE